MIRGIEEVEEGELGARVCRNEGGDNSIPLESEAIRDVRGVEERLGTGGVLRSKGREEEDGIAEECREFERSRRELIIAGKGPGERCDVEGGVGEFDRLGKEEKSGVEAKVEVREGRGSKGGRS